MTRMLTPTSRSGISRAVVATSLLALFGTFKFFQFEADAIQPLVSHSPVVGWVFALFSVRTASAIIGVVEVGAALLL